MSRARLCHHCGRPTRDSSYCPACQQARWAEQGRQRPPRPWYGAGWARIRTDALTAQPWCSTCGSTEKLTVDHIIPRSLAGGVQVLCQACNNRKAAADRKRRLERTR